MKLNELIDLKLEREDVSDEDEVFSVSFEFMDGSMNYTHTMKSGVVYNGIGDSVCGEIEDCFIDFMRQAGFCYKYDGNVKYIMPIRTSDEYDAVEDFLGHYRESNKSEDENPIGG